MSKLSGVDTSTSYLVITTVNFALLFGSTKILLKFNITMTVTSCYPRQSLISEERLPFGGWLSHVGLLPRGEILLLEQGLP